MSALLSDLSDIRSACCFTGHRSLKEDDISPVVLALRREILRLYDLGVDRYFAGGALGFDMAAACALLYLKQEHPAISLTLALPCRDHTASWNRQDRIRLDSVMERTDRVIYVTDGAYENGCMLRRNRYMVDRSGTCIAWYDGRKGGGTLYTVKYAASKNRTVINIYGK